MTKQKQAQKVTEFEHKKLPYVWIKLDQREQPIENALRKKLVACIEDAMEQARQNVARQIFEEIERDYLDLDLKAYIIIPRNDWRTLKSKYLGENREPEEQKQCQVQGGE
jgi:hypothetical protein